MSDIRNYVSSDRRDFEHDSIRVKDLTTDPLNQFEQWLEEAVNGGVREPYAFCLSTLGLDGYPSSRIVFLRGIEERGLIFYTNYSSLKGAELAEDERAAFNFHWDEQDRQIRVKGKVVKIDKSVSDAYYAKRPRGSQLGAWASSQSQVLGSRQELIDRIKDLEAKYDGQDIPRPEHWGGYILEPESWEFWQGRQSRLHDRFRYQKQESVWTIHRLNP